MAKSDLLKEAIADARAVKETALANAKIALQEAFVPRVTAMFGEQLEQELVGEDEDAMNPEMPTEGMYGEGMYEEEDMDMEAGADAGAGEDAEGVNWVDNDISFSVGGDTYDYEISEPASEEEEVAAAPAAGGDEFEEGGDEEDLNLESLIRELEMDANAMAEPDTMDLETEGMYEEDDMMSDEPMPEDPANEGYIDEIIESILREEDMDGKEKEDIAEELEDAKEDLANKTEELQEAIRTVRYLKSVINEVNLLNAKLLYTNKLFRNFELNEGQKMKVIENFDRAGTTREVKLVFTTLAESFKRPTKKRVVRESYASRPVASTAPRTAPILNEGFELADRWKKLAGLL